MNRVDEGALSFVVICEALADRQTACELADRVLRAEVDWAADMLEHLRDWRGLTPAEPFLRTASVPALARAHRIQAHGFGTGDAKVLRQALLLLQKNSPMPRAVLWIRDTDGDEGRKKVHLEPVRRHASEGKAWPFAVVLGIAHPKRECWALAGYDPCSREEEERLKVIRQQLGSDPRLHAEQLTASRGHAKPRAKRDPKEVLAELVAGDRDREVACWTETDLGVLRERGHGTGLCDYLDEVADLLARLFKSPP